MLGSDSGRLQARIEATLAIQPRQKEAIAWGAMLRHVQKGPVEAMNWARQQTPHSQVTLKEVQALLERLETRSASQTSSPFDAAQKKPQSLPWPTPVPAPPTVQKSPIPEPVSEVVSEPTLESESADIENSRPEPLNSSDENDVERSIETDLDVTSNPAENPDLSGEPSEL